MRVVGGQFRGKKIFSPLHKGTRPTSDRTREMIFNVLLHNPYFDPQFFTDKAVLDGFAGTGAFGLEAFSRGAKTVHFIENNKDMLPVLYKNIEAFGLLRSSVFETDARQFRCPTSSPYDVIFLDPPYRQGLITPTLKHLFDQGCISEKTVVIIEKAKDEAFSAPSFLSLVTEKTSGLTKVLFYLKKI